MPTGYTAELMDKGQDFRAFVLTCARAMGATIMQRDDPLNQPPKKQEPSDYYTKAITEAQARLVALKGMPIEERLTEGRRLRTEAVHNASTYHAKEIAENARLDAMAVQVKAWEPPSDDHTTLKSFMLQQIEVSRNDLKYTEERVRTATDKSPESYFVEALSKAVRDISYYEEELAKEIERTNGRNGWIEKLYESLPT